MKRVDAGESHGERLQSDLAEVNDVGKLLNELVKGVEEAQVKLARAQKQLKTTQKEMDEYTHVISHDLKEPLRGIEAFSKFLVDDYRDKLDEEGRHRVDVIRNSAAADATADQRSPAVLTPGPAAQSLRAGRTQRHAHACAPELAVRDRRKEGGPAAWTSCRR